MGMVLGMSSRTILLWQGRRLAPDGAISRNAAAAVGFASTPESTRHQEGDLPQGDDPAGADRQETSREGPHSASESGRRAARAAYVGHAEPVARPLLVSGPVPDTVRGGPGTDRHVATQIVAAGHYRRSLKPHRRRRVHHCAGSRPTSVHTHTHPAIPGGPRPYSTRVVT